MWYPSQEQQQQHSWYGYVHHPASQQQQQIYSRTSYYCNDDELSTTCAVAINHENESPTSCQTTYDSNIHVTTPDCYVITSNSSYGDQMASYQTTRKPYWSPVIAAPTKNMTVIPAVSSSPSACWDWLLFSPEYYSEFYTPSSTFVHHHQKKVDEEENNEIDYNFLASLPTCLLALLYLTPTLSRPSNEENDSDQEIPSLHGTDEPLLASILSDQNSNSNIDGQQTKTNRSSTPDTDDGYQSASDASRSDYAQQLSIPSDHHHHHHSRDDITIPAPLMPRRISYAAAVKPIITTANKISSFPTPINKPKQTMTNISSNEMLNSNGQKLKFIAPRFERMHHAKQHSSSSSASTTPSNRTQIRSTNHNQRNHIVNPTRRR